MLYCFVNVANCVCLRTGYSKLNRELCTFMANWCNSNQFFVVGLDKELASPSKIAFLNSMIFQKIIQLLI